MSGRERSRFSDILFGTAVTLLSLGLALAALETGTRWARPDLEARPDERVTFCTYDSTLGWRNRPSVRGEFFGTEVVHNASGQRDRERDVLESPGHLRVMVVGDSFVWGYRVDARDRFTDRLEKLVPDSEIMNFGCSGYGQDQEYLLLERELSRYSPDLVIVGLHAYSDLENNVSSSQYGYHKPLFSLDGDRLVVGNVPVPTDSLGTQINRWMTVRSVLWNLVGEKTIGGVGVKTRFVEGPDALVGGRAARAVHSKMPRVEMTCRLTAAIADFVVRQRARVLVMLIPSVELHDQVINPAPEYAELRDCLAERGVPTLDLDPVFRAYVAATPKGMITFGDDRHWSPEGHRIVSEALAAHLYNDASALRERRASASAR